jgi:hypothetical protein
MALLGFGVFSPFVLEYNYLFILTVGNYLSADRSPINIWASNDGIRTVVEDKNLFYLNIITCVDVSFSSLTFFPSTTLYCLPRSV